MKFLVTSKVPTYCKVCGEAIPKQSLHFFGKLPAGATAGMRLCNKCLVSAYLQILLQDPVWGEGGTWDSYLVEPSKGQCSCGQCKGTIKKGENRLRARNNNAGLSFNLCKSCLEDYALELVKLQGTEAFVSLISTVKEMEL